MLIASVNIFISILFLAHILVFFFFIFGKQSTWLWKIARGISGDEVEDRLLPKSHGCGKTFPGPMTLRTTSSVRVCLCVFQQANL